MTPHRASDTAILIARSLVLADAGPPGWFEFCVRRGWSRWVLLTTERLLLPGVFLHYLVRKHRIVTLVTDALREDCGQLVVLGAGLDTLAWRHARAAPGSPCFELDHAATQAIKQRAFSAQAPSQPVPHLIPINLACEPPSERLRSNLAFSTQRASVFVAEGLLMYLAAERVRALLCDLATCSAPGSRLVFTFMETRPGRPLAFHNARRVVNLWLRVRGEPFRWGIARADVAAFAAACGWKLLALSDPAELRASVLAPLGLADAPLALGESIALLVKPSEPTAGSRSAFAS